MAQSSGIVRKTFRVDELFSSETSDFSDVETIDPLLLTERARWIRDVLDPGVAVEGPSFLNPDQVVILFTFLSQLRRARIPLLDIRTSRINLAVMCIASRATRWPGSLIDEADKLLESWTLRYDGFQDITTPLYEEGGRLHGIALATDLSFEVLQVKWLRATNSRVQSCYALQSGDIGFKPGDWWINTMFAYQAGVLDSGKANSRIIADRRNAYAVLLAADDEIDSPDPNRFTYRANCGDVGRYRLVAATPASREPIRVLRSHTLRSFWAPRAGVRYDGLYRVTGWRVFFLPAEKVWNYDIEFQRLKTEMPMSEVMRRPDCEDLDDYKEYKRSRHEVRQNRNELGRAKPLAFFGGEGSSSHNKIKKEERSGDH